MPSTKRTFSHTHTHIHTQEAFYDKPVVVADREMVESEADTILAGADTEDVSFLVVGDPFGCVGVWAGVGVWGVGGYCIYILHNITMSMYMHAIHK